GSHVVRQRDADLLQSALCRPLAALPIGRQFRAREQGAVEQNVVAPVVELLHPLQGPATLVGLSQQALGRFAQLKQNGLFTDAVQRPTRLTLGLLPVPAGQSLPAPGQPLLDVEPHLNKVLLLLAILIGAMLYGEEEAAGKPEHRQDAEEQE